MIVEPHSKPKRHNPLDFGIVPPVPECHNIPTILVLADDSCCEARTISNPQVPENSSSFCAKVVFKASYHPVLDWNLRHGHILRRSMLP